MLSHLAQFQRINQIISPQNFHKGMGEQFLHLDLSLIVNIIIKYLFQIFRSRCNFLERFVYLFELSEIYPKNFAFFRQISLVIVEH